ncbi:MAG: SynChlorMet cassette radical SAM/SPASM protein ScmF [Verrucomicrobia bacterium]|nr:SynChlorMet cassette radical SAM/SPASM protein ScmF [Verrucomicrobiota bacterium]
MNLTTLYCYLTEGCNLACRHCWIAPKFQAGEKKYPSLDFDLFCDIIRQAKPIGLNKVKLTGGEPLLHPRILDLLGFIRAEQLDLIIESNGVLCTPELAAEIKRGKNAFISVSLDGADAATNEWVRGVKGSFDQAVDGIRNLAAAGMKPQIIMSLMRHNRDQVEAMVRLAESLGAGSVKFNLVQPTERGEQLRAAGETLSVAELIELGRWVETDLAPRAGIPLFYSHPPAFRPLSRLFFSASDGCGQCGIFGILGVLANGSYALCGIGESVPELVFGHAAKDRLETVWRDSPVLKEIRDGLPARLEGVCSRCVHRAMCLGSCIAQNYYRTRNLSAPFWFCAEAEEQGLFPASRLVPSNGR